LHLNSQLPTLNLETKEEILNPTNPSILPAISGGLNPEKDAAKGKKRGAVKLETLKVPRASELVADKLRALIIEGKVEAGSNLPPEKELVVQLGVSRATLREALRMLETEGLISTKTGPKGGILVKKPGTANLTRSLDLLLQLESTPFSHLLEARRLLEPVCANIAAERITAEEIENLRANLELMRQNVDDMEAYLAYQLKFHLAIFAAAHNDVMRLYTTSVGELITTQTAKIGLTEKQRLVGIKAAEGILAALVSRNGSLAARRAETHLKAFDAILLGRSVDKGKSVR
jgi:GntR family transcriptional regulator, transcriptional repressor for pyruvate dehydrogenase complex